MQITASVFMSDDESGPHRDYDAWLEQIATHEPVSQYRHNGTVEDNADAHIKRPIMGREVVVAVTDGQLDFGTWEQIYYDDRVRCGYAGGGGAPVLQAGWGETEPSAGGDGADEPVCTRIAPGAEAGADDGRSCRMRKHPGSAPG